MEDSCLKAHLNISVQEEVFIRRERGSRPRKPRGKRLKSSLYADWHSPFRYEPRNCSSDGLVCAIWVSPLQVSTSLRAGMTKGWSWYLLELVLTIFIQTCCLSTSYILVSQHLQGQCQKNIGVDYICHCYGCNREEGAGRVVKGEGSQIYSNGR
ncbi:hypothetical protein HJG60_010118 [Phyllostomus discolor]|uniref:Uncharacterized protein n=1 Tax=Phyllostomus discolor TaxID=89673 RepID=A0A834AYQ2_9CHIR|nr:hypothetical protein HJG60_010118 [Phyllostomus discolor]